MHNSSKGVCSCKNSKSSKNFADTNVGGTEFGFQKVQANEKGDSKGGKAFNEEDNVAKGRTTVTSPRNVEA